VAPAAHAVLPQAADSGRVPANLAASVHALPVLAVEVQVGPVLIFAPVLLPVAVAENEKPEEHPVGAALFVDSPAFLLVELPASSLVKLPVFLVEQVRALFVLIA
jgi:hypothetical protein